MGDKDNGSATLAAQRIQLVHGGLLARRVEREQRLIGENELGVVGQRLGLADELLLAAG